MIDKFQIYNDNFRLWDNEISQFEKKYRNSTINKIKLFLGFYRKKLNEHKEKLNKFCAETNQHYSALNLYEKHKLLDKAVPLNEVFLKQVVDCKLKAIKEREDSIGYTWRITNKKTNTVHYVVGTIHWATKHMIKNPSIKMAVENTKLLVTEVKASKLLLFVLNLLSPAIDNELMKVALKRKNRTLGC